MSRTLSFPSTFAPIMLSCFFSIAHAQPVKYSPTAPDPSNTYVALNAPAACKNAAIIADAAMLEKAADPRQIQEALNGKESAQCPCAAPGGAMQEDGMCKAQVYKLKSDTTVYQGAPPGPYAKHWTPQDMFWMPYDPRFVTSVVKVHKCIVPKGAVVVAGIRRNPHNTSSEEYVTQWYLPDTTAAGGRKNTVPARWRCQMM